ncbi:MAG: prephenate dehydrogenase [Planctomycetes bacterium]|nr:prephenate dehydrogenase [Planctomycetota bacterium]
MKIAITGAGHMGSWLAKELSAGNSIAIYDTDTAKAASAAAGIKNCRSFDGISGLKEFAPEMFINTASLQNTVAAYKESEKFLPKDCVLCDVASVKNGLPEYYTGCGFRFVSFHPMFGPTFADMNALKEENVVLIRESDETAAEFFRAFFKRLGLRIFEYSFAEHDRMMAYSLTIPFVSSLVFAACVDATAVPGTTFSRHINIARGLLSEDDHLLAEILFNPNSLEKIEKITSRLEYLKHIIKGRDSEEITKFFNKLRNNVTA